MNYEKLLINKHYLEVRENNDWGKAFDVVTPYVVSRPPWLVGASAASSVYARTPLQK